MSVQSCDVKLSTHFSVNLANDPTQLRKLKQILIFMLIQMLLNDLDVSVSCH